MFSGNNSNTPADSFTNFLNWQHQQQVIASNEPHFDWGALAKQWIQSNATLCQPAANQIFSIATHQAQQPTMSYQNRMPDAPPPPILSYQNDRQPQVHQPLKSPAESHQHDLNDLDQEQGEADMEVEKEEDIIDPNAASNAQFSNIINTSGPPEWLDPSASMPQNPQINFANPWQWQNNLPPPQLHIPTLIGSGNISNSLGNLNNNLSMSITPLIKPDDTDEKSNQIDAAKRKTLPAWIREGLEKMEREKQKQMEKEKEKELKLQSGEKDKKLLNILNQSGGTDNRSGGTTFVGTNSNTNQVPSEIKSIAKNISTKTDSDSSSEYDGQQKYKTNRRVSTENNDDNTRKHSGKSYDELVEELMIAVKRTLTEILLEVTNSEIYTIATEEYKRHKLKASSAQVFRKSALSSITGKLGLGAYGGSSDSDDSDGNNSEQENDSDAELEEKIRTCQNAFKGIAKEMEERIMYEEAKREQRKRDREERHDTSRNSHYFNSNSGAGAVQSTSSSSRKKYSKNFGETHPEKKSYFSNGKSHLKKRTSRFSDNNDSRSKPSSSQYLVPTPSSSTQILLANAIQKDKDKNPTNLLQKLSKDNKSNKSSSSSSSSDTESSSTDSSSDSNSSENTHHTKKSNKTKSERRKNDRSSKDDNQRASNNSSIKKKPNDSSRSDDRYESNRSNRRKDDYLQKRKRRQNSSDSDDYHRGQKQSSSSRSYSKRSKSRGHSSRGERSRSRSRSNYSSSSRRYDRY